MHDLETIEKAVNNAARQTCIEEFSKRLEQHDWYFSYSDDHRAWKKGHDESNAINMLAAKDPALKEVLHQFLRHHNMLAADVKES
jgi:spore coat protein CotF